MSICSLEPWYGVGSEPSWYLLRRQFQTPLTRKGGLAMKKLLIAALVAFLGFAAFTFNANAVASRAGSIAPAAPDLAALARTTGTHIIVVESSSVHITDVALCRYWWTLHHAANLMPGC
jgi:hypothetical protein